MKNVEDLVIFAFQQNDPVISVPLNISIDQIETVCVELKFLVLQTFQGSIVDKIIVYDYNSTKKIIFEQRHFNKILKSND